MVLEKPFGVDLESAIALNKLVHGVFAEERVFRIDHFLGREAVQNLIALRFANGMFEPIWNKDHIDHVQIDVPETLAVDDRAGFYEETGAYRDMVVTHLFHVLGFVAMEPPTDLDGRSIVEETGKVFRSVQADQPQLRDPRPVRRLPRGRGRRPRLADRDLHRDARRDRQLALVGRAVLPAHRQADGRVAAAADDRLPRAAAADVQGGGRVRRGLRPRPHLLRLRRPGRDHDAFLAKVPGPKMRLGQARMEFTYDDSFGTQGLEPYERLMYDAMLGDRTLFTDSEGIERLWAASADLLSDPPPLHRYAPGSYGPQKMHELIAPRRWWLPET